MKTTKWSNEELKSALRLASKELKLEKLTLQAYKQWRDLREDAKPSPMLFIKRYGSWSKAVSDAGLESGSLRGYAPLKYTKEDCMEYLSDFVKDDGVSRKSSTEYEAWVKRNGGPSISTVRNKFDGLWTEAIESVK